MPAITDYAYFIIHVRALRTRNPELTVSQAAQAARHADPALASRVLDTVGSWPSSEPEILALQRLR